MRPAGVLSRWIRPRRAIRQARPEATATLDEHHRDLARASQVHRDHRPGKPAPTTAMTGQGRGMSQASPGRVDCPAASACNAFVIRCADAGVGGPCRTDDRAGESWRAAAATPSSPALAGSRRAAPDPGEAWCTMTRKGTCVGAGPAAQLMQLAVYTTTADPVEHLLGFSLISTGSRAGTRSSRTWRDSSCGPRAADCCGSTATRSWARCEVRDLATGTIAFTDAALDQTRDERWSPPQVFGELVALADASRGVVLRRADDGRMRAARPGAQRRFLSGSVTR